MSTSFLLHHLIFLFTVDFFLNLPLWRGFMGFLISIKYHAHWGVFTSCVWFIKIFCKHQMPTLFFLFWIGDIPFLDCYKLTSFFWLFEKELCSISIFRWDRFLIYVLKRTKTNNQKPHSSYIDRTFVYKQWS